MKFIIVESVDGNIETYSTGYSDGELYFSKDYIVDGNIAGRLQYSDYNGEPYIQMIEVHDNYRRKGIATKLMVSLQKEYNGIPIHTGMLTSDGLKMISSITNEVPNVEYKRKLDIYKKVNKKLSDIQSGWDLLWEEGDSIPEDDEKMLDSWREKISNYGSLVDRKYNSLSDLKYDLEIELNSMPKTFIYVKDELL